MISQATSELGQEAGQESDLYTMTASVLSLKFAQQIVPEGPGCRAAKCL